MWSHESFKADHDWLTDTKQGGAFGFITETSPGPAIPPLASLRKFIPPEHLWPTDECWNYHAGAATFKDIKVFTQALNARYGEAKSVEDFVMKAQAMGYDGQRAMYEACGRNKYAATGVLQEMLNNAWPSLIWALYDYYLRPGGGYFGSKKALEPVHVQYSYDDRSIAVVNSLYHEFKNLKATARVYNFDLTEKFSKKVTLDVPEEGVVRPFEIPEISNLSTTYLRDVLSASGETTCLRGLCLPLQWNGTLQSEIVTRPGDALQVVLVFEFDLRLGA